MGVASSSLVNRVRSRALMVRLAPNLLEALCELTRAVRDKTYAQTEVSGLLFGKSEDAIVTAQALKTFGDSGPRSDLARRERMEKAFEAAMAQANADSEFSSYKLLGWFSLRGSGGLINSDVEFHNRHFRDADDIALIVWREGDSQITAELYATVEGKLTTEDYRWSSVRLSTELRSVSQPVDLIMRPRVNDDRYVRTYSSEDKQERREEWKKITTAARRAMFSMLPGRSHAGEQPAYLPKPEPSDSALGKRSFESRTLFRDAPAAPAAKPSSAVASARAQAADAIKPSVPHESSPAPRPPVPEISGLPMVIRRKPAKGIPWLSLALVAMLCSGLTFAVYALNGVGTGSSKLSQVIRVLFPGTDLELRAEGSGDRLLLTWNRRNQVVASAASAVLSITDGPQHFERKLDPVQIANGSVLYRPITGDVTFRLQVFGTDQAIAISSLRVLDATAAPSVAENQPVTNKPALDSANIAAAERAIPPPSARGENHPLPDAAPAADHSASRPNLLPIVAPNTRAEQASTNLKAAAPDAQQSPPESAPAETASQPQNLPQQSAARSPSPLTTAAKQASRPNNAPPVTSNTAINGWDPNLPEKKPAPPQETAPPAVVPPPDAKAVAFIGPKVLLQVMPNVRNLSSSSVDQITRVEVEVTVDTNGRVKSARLLSPNVKGPLASAAVSAAKQWTFQPATLRGLRVESDHSIVFEFRPGEQ